MTTTEEYIIYGVAGGLVFLAILFVIIFCCVYYKRRKKEEKEEKQEEQKKKEKKRKQQHKREKEKQRMRALEAQHGVGMNPTGAGFYGQPMRQQTPGRYDLLTVRHSDASFTSSNGLNFDMVPPGALLQPAGPHAGYQGYRGPMQVQVHPSPQRNSRVREMNSSDENYSSDDDSRRGSQSDDSEDSDASKTRKRRKTSDSSSGSESNYSSDSSYDKHLSQTKALAVQPPVVYTRQPINAGVPVPQMSGYPTVHAGYAPGGQPMVYTTQPVGMTHEQAAMNRALAGPDGYYNRGVIFRNAPYMPTHALNPNQGLSSSAPTRLSGYVPAPSNPPVNLTAKIEPGWAQQHYNMSMAALRHKGEPPREPKTMALSKFAPYWANKVQPLENHQTQWQYYKDWEPLR